MGHQELKQEAGARGLRTPRHHGSRPRREDGRNEEVLGEQMACGRVAFCAWATEEGMSPKHILGFSSNVISHRTEVYLKTDMIFIQPV